MVNLKLKQVLAAIEEESAAEGLLPFWEESMVSLPDGVPGFLDSGHLREVMEYARIEPEEYDRTVRVAHRIACDGALKRLAWHCRRTLYEEPRVTAKNIKAWPSFSTALGEDAHCFYFIIALAAVDYARSFHREKGIPEKISRDTCADVGRFRPCYVNVRVNVPDTLTWLRHHASGDLFKIGRHQYIRESFRGEILVFKNKNGGVLALSEGERKYNTRGFCDGDGGVVDPHAWISTLEMDEHQVKGFPVSPYGYAVRQEVCLDLNEWFLVLLRGAPILAMHIPPFEAMPLEATGVSMRDAISFFRRYFPERTFRALTCQSWMFNTQIQEVLGEQANISAWQRETYLYPDPSAEPSGLSFIFGFRPFDIATAQRDTRLRRGVIERLNRGEAWRSGAMFFLSEDVRHFGSQFYIRGWKEICRQLGVYC